MSPDTPEPEAQAPLPESVTPERLTELFKREYPRLVELAYRGLSRHKKDRRDAAEDIVDRALQKVLEKHHESVVIGNLIAYLREAVRNELRNEYRQDDKRRETEPALDYELERIAPSPEWLCLSEEQERLLQETVEALPAKCRAAFRWMMWEHLARLRGFASGFEGRRYGGPRPFRHLRAHGGRKWL